MNTSKLLDDITRKAKEKHETNKNNHSQKRINKLVKNKEKVWNNYGMK